MKIDTDEQVAKVRASGIRELFIDTARGDDVSDAPTRREAAAETERQLANVGQTQKPRIPERRASLAEELSRAKNTFGEATRVIRNVMDDIRLGRQMEVDTARDVVEKITGSVMRNGNAMMTMRRLKSNDDYTFLHSVSVCTMLTSFARAMGFDAGMTQEVALGALLHDIGKMRVNLSLLNKPAKLSTEEFRHMKSHVVLGSDLLRQMQGVPAIAFEPLELHHERFDGSGYPHGLKGNEISLVGRMSAIVDVYDAITSERCYHEPISPPEAIRKLFEWSKHHFDAELVQVFVKSVGIYPVGALVRLESGRLGIVLEQRDSNLLTPVVRVVFDGKRNYYLAPEDVDLSRPVGAGGGDRIVGHESPGKWGIDVTRFIGN